MVLLKHTPPPLIDPDYYEATVESITVVRSEKPRLDGSTEYLEWKFAVHVDGGAPAVLTAFTSLKFGGGKKAARARKWTEALFGRGLTAAEIEDGIDTDKLVGRPCRVNIVHHTMDDGTVVNRIADVAPPKERKAVSL